MSCWKATSLARVIAESSRRSKSFSSRRITADTPASSIAAIAAPSAPARSHHSTIGRSGRRMRIRATAGAAEFPARSSRSTTTASASRAGARLINSSRSSHQTMSPKALQASANRGRCSTCRSCTSRWCMVANPRASRARGPWLTPRAAAFALAGSVYQAAAEPTVIAGLPHAQLFAWTLRYLSGNPGDLPLTAPAADRDEEAPNV